MGDLSEHFDSSEFRDPVTGEARIVPRLVAALELLRQTARRPIRITSGYRSAQHNTQVGGTARSRHLIGEAADIQIVGLTVLQMYAVAEQVPAFRDGGIGIYPQEGILHVDVRGTRARWARLGGSYVDLASGIRAVVNG